MQPSQVSSTLRKIATKIDNSVNPKRELLVKDIKKVITAMEQSTNEEKAVLKRMLFNLLDGLNISKYDDAFGGNSKTEEEIKRRENIVYEVIDKIARAFGLRV